MTGTSLSRPRSESCQRPVRGVLERALAEEKEDGEKEYAVDTALPKRFSGVFLRVIAEAESDGRSGFAESLLIVC